MGCLPKALFFNAFKLGIRILNDALMKIENVAKEGIKKQNMNTLKSNILPMHGNLVNK